jgi:hypothetical protein
MLDIGLIISKLPSKEMALWVSERGAHSDQREQAEKLEAFVVARCSYP